MLTTYPHTYDNQMIFIKQIGKWINPDNVQTPTIVELRQAIVDLYQLLLQDSCYPSLIETAIGRNPDITRPWGWIPLIQTQDLHAGLLTAYRLYSPPLHDHPNSSGTQLVIHGRIRIQHFNIPDPTEISQSIIKLERHDFNILSVGDTDGHTDTLGNIHQIEVETPRCLLLCMHIPPYEEHNRSWYLPVHPFEKQTSSLLVRRISRHNNSAFEMLPDR